MKHQSCNQVIPKKMGKVIKNNNKIELHFYLRNQNFIGDSLGIIRELYIDCSFKDDIRDKAKYQNYVCSTSSQPII